MNLATFKITFFEVLDIKFSNLVMVGQWQYNIIGGIGDSVTYNT